jgi:hypothetical protein
MSEVIEALERRVAALERDVAELRRALRRDGASPPTSAESPRPRPPALDKRMRDILAQMGIQGEPIGAEALQKMILDRGADPHGTEARRLIEEMREE